MFVPPPNQNFKLFVKDDQHDWKDVFSEVVQQHQSNRLGGHENTFLSLSGALRYYSSTAEKKSFLKVDDGNNINLRVLDQVLVGYCMSQHQERPRNMEIIILITDTYDNKSYAHYYKN